MSAHNQKQPPTPPPNTSVDGIIPISKENFTEFIKSPYAVIWAGPGFTPSIFPAFLRFRLGLFHSPQVKLGTADFLRIEWTPAVKFIVAMHLGRHGLKADALGRPPDGFYLFANGTLLGFEPNDLEINKDNGLFWIGAFTGVIGILSNNPQALHVASHMATWQMGERVAQRFEELIGQHFSASLPGSEAPPPSSEISDPIRRAYAALGLSPDASDQEVSAAHKRLVKEHHPDRAAKTQEAQNSAHRRTAEVNAARDAIRRHRGER